MFGLGKGNITVSTVGVVPSMKKLNAELPGVAVALSLHAPNQALRERIVPAARAWPLPRLMQALDMHIQTTKQFLLEQKKVKKAQNVSMMVEYVLLAGVNDKPEHAIELAELLKGKAVMVNLIPYNKNVTAEMYGFESPTHEAAYAFGKMLIDRGLRARVRIERGADIAAACGQLALTAAGTKMAGGVREPGASKTRNSIADIEDLMGGSQPGSKNNKREPAASKRQRGERARRPQRMSAKQDSHGHDRPLASWDDFEQLCCEEAGGEDGCVEAAKDDLQNATGEEGRADSGHGLRRWALQSHGWFTVAAAAAGIALLVVYARRSAGR